ncbi:MAG TPA: CinA family protein [Chlamydiales bacterium]|nr:CinA family protein [Chlamydiales bacterium]
MFHETRSLCLLKEIEVEPVLQELREKHPEVEISLTSTFGSLQILFKSKQPVDKIIREMEKKFPTFMYGEGRIEEAVHREFIAEKKTLALAESITGGRLAAQLTAIPGASKFLLGSIVAYSTQWKERFLHMSHSTPPVSREAVEQMVQGLFEETDADFAAALSGMAGPDAWTLYIAVGRRGTRIDSGKIALPQERNAAIEFATQTALGALWRRIAHNAFTFS